MKTTASTANEDHRDYGQIYNDKETVAMLEDIVEEAHCALKLRVFRNLTL